MTPDLRLLTGPSQLVIGLICLFFGCRLWLTNRTRLVFRLAPYFSADGIDGVVRMRLLLTVIGAYFETSGVSSIRFWYLASQQLYDPIVAVLGGSSAVLAVSAAAIAVRDTVRWLRQL